MWRREAVRALFEVVFGEDRVVGHLVCVALEGVEGERFILSNYRTPTRHRKPVVIGAQFQFSPNQGFQSVSIPIGVTYARRKNTDGMWDATGKIREQPMLLRPGGANCVPRIQYIRRCFDGLTRVFLNRVAVHRTSAILNDQRF